MTDTPDPDETLAQAVRDWWNAKATSDDHPALLRSWHLAMEGMSIDDDGDECTTFRTKSDGSIVAQLGLLDYATTKLRGRLGA